MENNSKEKEALKVESQTGTPKCSEGIENSKDEVPTELNKFDVFISEIDTKGSKTLKEIKEGIASGLIKFKVEYGNLKSNIYWSHKWV
ncbi:hypothetical protein EI427_25280 [Flammeovirga pectinis]|uniref:Uncharacterized protein n=1 Tax=Flammeovirga pectinis TaxID=2494373 RepID=A0A3Q9FQV5_9BACT|nr:hypothetical protein [Flammeovirga pectinis]AZQ65528.1 hypothetical protein EI427_25280 [Flammeovirga pectinis]